MKEGGLSMLVCLCVVCVHSVRVCCVFFSMCNREESTQGIPQRDAIAPNKERGLQIRVWREEEEVEEEEQRQAKNKKEACTWYLGHSTHNQTPFCFPLIVSSSFNLFVCFISLASPANTFLHSVLAVLQQRHRVVVFVFAFGARLTLASLTVCVC